MSLTVNFIRDYTQAVQTEALGSKNRREVKDQQPSFVERRYRPTAALRETPAPGVHFHYSDNSWNWGNSWNSYVPAFYGAAPVEGWMRKEEKNINFNWATLLGPLMAIAGAALSGYAYQLVAASRKSLVKIEGIYQVIKQDNWDDNVSNSVRKAFKSLVKEQRDVDQMLSSKVSHYFFATAGMLAGGASLFVGGVTMAPWFVITGQVTLFVAGLMAAINFGRHFNDEEVLEKHYTKLVGEGGRSGLAASILREVGKRSEPSSTDESSAKPPAEHGGSRIAVVQDVPTTRR